MPHLLKKLGGFLTPARPAEPAGAAAPAVVWREPTAPISLRRAHPDRDAAPPAPPAPRIEIETEAETETETPPVDLSRLNAINGFIGACLVDAGTGRTLGETGGEGVNLRAAASGNAAVVRAKNKAMVALGLGDQIEDILITLDKQLHLIRPLGARPTTFLYLALRKQEANLGIARITLRRLERELPEF